MLADIGMIGLAVMGSNLVKNMLGKGYTVAVYNREPEMTEHFAGQNKGQKLIATYSYEELVANIARPRKIMMMIRAGAPVDMVLDRLLPLLDKGDIVIDGGNSYFRDTIRRTQLLESKGLRYIGTGVSGGEEGALHGPSLMPGGSPSAWEDVKPILQSISAKVDGVPCCDWVGENGAGHFVKMVHNGIEYGDMQLISESYALLRGLLGLDAEKMSAIFREWNGTELDSYLIGITGNILAKKDTDGAPLIEKILDVAGQKGTGKWTGISSLEEGVPLTMICEAVHARCLSSMKEERVRAAKVYPRKAPSYTVGKEAFIEDLRRALYCAKIVSYAQGYTLMRAAAGSYHWNLNYGGIALMWRGGCIIRSRFLGKIREAFVRDPALENLLLDPYFKEILERYADSWRRVVAAAVMNGVPVPAMSSALEYFDGYTSEKLPANLLQAQRDYFGAHTYERVDAPRGQFFHTDWTGEGGDTPSTTYEV